MILVEIMQAHKKEQSWGNRSLYEYLFRFIESRKHIRALKTTIPIKPNEQTNCRQRYLRMLRATFHPLERGNMSKELCFLSCCDGADTHLFQSQEGFYSFSGTVSIFIEASATYLQDRNPVALAAGWSLLYFGFALFFKYFGEAILALH